jgi:hypothetical protein
VNEPLTEDQMRQVLVAWQGVAESLAMTFTPVIRAMATWIESLPLEELRGLLEMDGADMPLIVEGSVHD